MAFLRFIVIFFLVIYILRIITMFFFRRYIKKIQKQFEQQQSFNQNQNHKEGDIIIEKPIQNKKGGFEDKGEYVDYEEIK